jgi:PKHD-type hydroxylase
MNLKYYYWYFQSALPKSFCNDLIKYGNEKQEETALTGGYKVKSDKGQTLSETELKDLKKKRDSNIVWLNEPWVYSEIHPYVYQANENAGWNFQWDWSESCQFTKYKKDQYYGWHCDSWDEPYNDPKNKNFYGKIRKLSVTCVLSEPDDYEGGELEFDFGTQEPDGKHNIRTCTEIKSQGSLVVFPSFVKHRVKPVTKGTRYSLVIWNLGQPYK